MRFVISICATLDAQFTLSQGGAISGQGIEGISPCGLLKLIQKHTRTCNLKIIKLLSVIFEINESSGIQKKEEYVS